MSDHLMQTYARLPVSFVRGEGAYLYDEQGEAYLDALGGIAVCALGHAHPAVTRAICEQAQTLLHTSNLYGIQNQQALADKLCDISGVDRVFFCNSGAEANEAAIKIARRYGHHRNIDIPHIVVMENSFHGRTLATLTATANRKAQQGFEPLVEGFIRVPYNDIEAVAALARSRDDIVAVLVEPVQGEGGINIPSPGYLQGLKQLCEKHQWLLMLDEIQSGVGRTGRWFAFQHENIQPDVLTSAKALGNGVPISACLARGHAADILQPGTHGTTFGGNPLACAAALAVLESIERDNLLARIAELGAYMLSGFQTALSHYTAGANPAITAIRGKGLMIGIQLQRDCADLVKLALAQKLLINVTAGNVVRLLPPYILNDSEAERIVETVSSLIKQFLATP
ncbi:MAG TPA: aspartate aminotransferase family protein [Gammaproteobacteria bacterium]